MGTNREIRQAISDVSEMYGSAPDISERQLSTFTRPYFIGNPDLDGCSDMPMLGMYIDFGVNRLSVLDVMYTGFDSNISIRVYPFLDSPVGGRLQRITMLFSQNKGGVKTPNLTRCRELNRRFNPDAFHTEVLKSAGFYFASELPERIDVEQTARAFLDQAINRAFMRPELVLP